jgi:hypothetical protein
VKVRLLKVVVQPVFVLDDGEELTEVQHPATVIPAAEWSTYSSERFPSEVAEWQQKLDAEGGEATGSVTSLRPPERVQASGPAGGST